MPYFDVRLKFLTVLMLIVVVVTITITSLRYGSSVLEENFVAELSTHYENSAEFLAFYGLLNFYLYTMAFVYSPAKNAVLESHFKDDPSLTMLNDSDEEVIYGAESEQQALTRKQFYDSEEEAFNN
ncbi:DgyrCDS7251 [Dimorphilus gyrociliatus]|uniref:DgyrCDS7251 n=1 Tax=Dimorphilus gyrociliatus TaxID=2664684 RepID=A0A7I8VQJ7_9ANNE|nr:DgyrCDS7251 [Dimorphilus gyrociliatus]